MSSWQPEFSAAEARESLGLPDGFDSERGDKVSTDQERLDQETKEDES